MNQHQLTGQQQDHLQFEVDGTCLHMEAGVAYERLQSAARNAGFDLRIASGFRSYERQCLLWGRKVERLTSLDDDSLHAILRWSAMPGASRHHWGTDMDIFDATALGDAKLNLEPEEYGPGGPFHALWQWLQVHAPDYGFFWPYAKDLGGVAVEPWHLSYQPVASNALKALSPDCLHAAWKTHPPAAADWLHANADNLFARYVMQIS
ncbi:M15 family metallopeptidase [Aliidiomarina sp. Khilg15.8]